MLIKRLCSLRVYVKLVMTLIYCEVMLFLFAVCWIFFSKYKVRELKFN